MVFDQEMESPSGGVPGETFLRTMCSAVCVEKIPGANISSSEPFIYAKYIVSTTEVSLLRNIKKTKAKRKISVMHGQFIQVQKKLRACDELENNRRHVRKSIALNPGPALVINSCSFHLELHKFLLQTNG